MDFDNTSETITPTKSTSLTINGTGALFIPTGTTAQRPGSPQSGYIRLNTDNVTLEYYNGTVSQWLTFGSSNLNAISNVSGNGLLAQTSAGNYAARVITGTSNQVSVSNGDGVAGNPTLSTPSTFLAPGTVQDSTGMLYSTSATISAAGSTQGTATALTTSYNIVTTVASGTGVRLPTPSTGGLIAVILNKGANSLNIYPATGGSINSGSANSPISIPSNTAITLQAGTTTQWYSTSIGSINGTGPIDGPVLSRVTYYANSSTYNGGGDGFYPTNNNDWAINSQASLSTDPSYSALYVILFPGNSETGAGVYISVPPTASYVKINYRGRLQSAPGNTTSNLQMNCYTRIVPDVGLPGSWSSAASSHLPSVSLANDAIYHYYSTGYLSLASVNLTAGSLYMVDFTRNTSVANNVNINWLMAELTFIFI